MLTLLPSAYIFYGNSEILYWKVLNQEKRMVAVQERKETAIKGLGAQSYLLGRVGSILIMS